MTDAVPSSAPTARERMLRAAAGLLADRPFASVALADVAAAAHISEADLKIHFPDMASIGNAILDRERSSMHEIMTVLRGDEVAAREKLVLAFEGVGKNLRADLVVRAGVRIASESRVHFPHRRLDPFATWDKFVADLLERAIAAGDLREAVNLDEATRVLVAAGMGTKDLIAFSGTWETAPAQMASIARALISYMSR